LAIVDFSKAGLMFGFDVIVVTILMGGLIDHVG
jgi:hypothetical protein